MPTDAAPPHHLADSSDRELAALLRDRPDLATPLPGSVTALAARASTVRSLQLAIAQLDTPGLATLDAVLALSTLARPLARVGAGSDPASDPAGTGPTAPGGPVTAEAAALATGLADVAPALATLHGLALVVPASPADASDSSGAPGATGATEPAEATAATADSWLPAPGLLAARPRPATLAVTVAPALTESDEIDRAARALSERARRVLDALTWGPPVGTVGEESGTGSAPGAPGDPGTADPTLAEAVAELRRSHLVRATGEREVVLPGATALVLRGGRTHRDLVAAAPTPPAVVVTPQVRAAESARAALEVLQHLRDLLDLWGAQPAGALRSGGVGVREIRRTASAIGADESATSLLVELAAGAGELGPAHDDDGALWAPTHAHDGEDPTARWARLAHTWFTSERAFALVGTRADDGALRSVLEPGLERGWAGRLRHRVLDALREWPDGAAPDAGAIGRHLAWHTPASPPPDWAVGAVLTEAALLGVTGAGALSSAGAALLGDGAGTDGAAAPPSAGDVEADTLARAAAALEADLPPAVGEVLLQADLTAIVPGRPAPALEELLLATTEIESRGSGLTARFTPTSLSRAIEQGRSAQEILDALAAASRTPLPQALEYAVRDAQRRHGGLRAGPAASYLRSDDPAVLAPLVHGGDLGLRLLAPTVAVSTLPAGRIAEVLRTGGQAVLLEGPDGVVLPPRSTTVATAPRRTRVSTAPTPERSDPVAAVARLREGERQAASAPDPAGGVAALRAAARDHATVWVTVVGPSGAVDRRRLAPLRVQGGHVVARDVERDSDLTIALHRIADVEPV